MACELDIVSRLNKVRSSRIRMIRKYHKSHSTAMGSFYAKELIDYFEMANKDHLAACWMAFDYMMQEAKEKQSS